MSISVGERVTETRRFLPVLPEKHFKYIFPVYFFLCISLGNSSDRYHGEGDTTK
jgi:hypothetical protein